MDIQVALQQYGKNVLLGNGNCEHKQVSKLLQGLESNRAIGMTLLN